MIRSFVLALAGFGLIHAAVTPISLAGQESGSSVSPTSGSPSSAAVSTVWNRTFGIHLVKVPLRDALTAISAKTGVRFAYIGESVPTNQLVSLEAERITVRDALSIILANTGLEPVMSSTGTVRLMSRTTAAMATGVTQQGAATLSGLVTDSGTGAIITQAIVHVDGTQLTVRTNATGHYTISGLAAGEYRVTARHVGYLAKTRVVTLTDSGAKAVDFLLNQPATTLNEVVTTAIGDERRYQVGNVISTINVDSIAPNSPATSVTDMITGRAPGVDVVESSGMVGSGEDIRIRGISSLVLQSDPIIIVDGIRVDNTPGGMIAPAVGTSILSNNTAPAPYRLNDLALDQIESIEILKGPAATTEYGTDGANGVIIITTKRGTSGKPQWSASASQTASTVPLSYPPVTWNWGHTTQGTATPFTINGGVGNSCYVQLSGGVDAIYESYANSLSFYYGLPGGVSSSALESGGCVVDSITSFNPLDHATTTEFGTGPASNYNLGVGGGTDNLRYYFNGNASNQVGVIQIPDVYRALALSLGFPNSLLRPNTQQQSAIMANTTIKASATVDAGIQLSNNTTYADFPDQEAINYGGIAATNSPVTNYGYSLQGGSGVRQGPLATALGTNTSAMTESWRGGATLNWRPVSWLSANVTAGVQHEAQFEQGEYTAQAALLISDYTDTAGRGSLSQQQGRNDMYTVTMNGAAQATLWRVVGLITTVGASYNDKNSSVIGGSAYGLSASDFSFDGASDIGLNSSAQSVKSGGMFVEENLSFTDRCYAPIGLRFDVASGYGSNVASTQNPDYSLTCTVLTGKTSLRLRGAYGVSDQQPPYGANQGAFQVESIQPANAGSPETVYHLLIPGNQEIKPERDQALEGGFDLGFWNQRVQVSFTAYNQRQHDLLWDQNIGWDLNTNYWENVGNNRNEGMELTVTANLIQSRALSLGVTLNGSVLHDKLLSLAPDLLTTQISGTQRFAVGYPAYGYWGSGLSYQDANHDGILESNEFEILEVYGSQFFNKSNFAGTSTPVEQGSMAPTIGVWRNAIRVNAMFNYGGDYKVYNANQMIGSVGGILPGMSTLDTPLWEQMFADGEYIYNGDNGAYSPAAPADAFFNGTYLSLDELSVSVDLPRMWVRAARLRNLSVVGGVQHLALWTAYPFGDPRVGVNADINNQVNNDVRVTALGVVPLTRQWTIRINAGF